MISAVTIKDGILQIWKNNSMISRFTRADYIDAATNGSTIFALKKHGVVEVTDYKPDGIGIKQVGASQTYTVGNNAEEGISISCGGDSRSFRVKLSSGRTAVYSPSILGAVRYEDGPPTTQNSSFSPRESQVSEETRNDFQIALQKCKEEFGKKSEPIYEYIGYGLSTALVYWVMGSDFTIWNILFTGTAIAWGYYGRHVMGRVAARWKTGLPYMLGSYLILRMGFDLLGFVLMIASFVYWTKPMWPFFKAIGLALAISGEATKGRNMGFGSSRIEF